jgi:L-aspartate oxidase
VADATGAAVQATLTEQVRAHPNISIFEQHIAVDLIVGDKIGSPGEGCLGAYVLDIASDEVRTFSAPHTVLATGGTARFTSTPPIPTRPLATGWPWPGGQVAGWRIWSSSSSTPPVSTTRRQSPSSSPRPCVAKAGCCAVPTARFMPDHDPREELAPRDVVARAIDFEMKKHGLDCVFLDISHKPADFLEEHFPEHPGPLC